MSRKDFRRAAGQEPVSVGFLGTIFHDKKDRSSAGLESVPASQALYDAALLEARARLASANKDCLNEAVALLSQTDTGRDLLERVTAHGYRFVFDDRRTGDRDAGGLCDPAEKLIILRAHDDAAYMALLMGHECVHALQNSVHDLFPSSRHRPDAGIMVSFAIEADAYAHMTQIALEMAHADLRGDTPVSAALEQLRARYPDIVAAAEKTLAGDDASRKSALRGGSAIAAAFDAFYSNDYLRSYYEDSHLSWLAEIAPRLTGPGKPKGSFTSDGSPVALKGKILHKGKPYLETHAPAMRLDDTRHSGLTKTSAAKVRAFYADHLPLDKVPDIKIFGLYLSPVQYPDAPARKDTPKKPANANDPKKNTVEQKPEETEKPSKIKAPRKRKRDFW